MERRALLRSAALGVTMGMVPAWMRHAFADDAEGCDEHSALLVRAALDRARRRGFPLLVLVVPTDSDKRSERPWLFGELIDLGPERTLATLALAEVVCASMATVRCVVPDGPVERPNDPPMFLVVDTAATDPSVTPLYVDIPPWSERPGPHTEAEELADWRNDVRGHVRRMTLPLRRALAGTDLLRRAAENLRALPKGDGARILNAADDGGTSLPLDLVDAGAPLLLASALATHDAEARRRVITRLAAAGRHRLRDRAPTGGRWLRWSCDTCGMGAVAALSRRFLEFDVPSAD
jgi:hypothetical protein